MQPPDQHHCRLNFLFSDQTGRNHPVASLIPPSLAVSSFLILAQPPLSFPSTALTNTSKPSQTAATGDLWIKRLEIRILLSGDMNFPTRLCKAVRPTYET
ncbi:hypothetical protein HAX54_035930, partial [Datura stramonium]|nr:hypothetical protein [Datura stramonium]